MMFIHQDKSDSLWPPFPPPPTMDWSMSGFSVPHCLLEFAQVQVQWISDAIQLSYSQSPSASSSFPMSWLFTSCGQSIGASASASVLPKSNQGWFPWKLTSLISLLFKGLSRVFSSTKVQKHQFFSLLYCPALISLHNYREDHSLDYTDLCQQSDLFAF